MKIIKFMIVLAIMLVISGCNQSVQESVVKSPTESTPKPTATLKLDNNGGYYRYPEVEVSHEVRWDMPPMLRVEKILFSQTENQYKVTDPASLDDEYIFIGETKEGGESYETPISNLSSNVFPAGCKIYKDKSRKNVYYVLNEAEDTLYEFDR